jgi:hypothetical protein
MWSVGLTERECQPSLLRIDCTREPMIPSAPAGLGAPAGSNEKRGKALLDYAGCTDQRHPGSADRRTLCQPVQPRRPLLRVIQQVPLTPETLTRYYVNSAAGQPVPLSNLVTLKTATEPNAV